MGKKDKKDYSNSSHELNVLFKLVPKFLPPDEITEILLLQKFNPSRRDNGEKSLS